LFFEAFLVSAHGLFGVDLGVAEAVFVAVGEGVEHADEAAGDSELSGVASFLWGYGYGRSAEVEVLPPKPPRLPGLIPVSLSSCRKVAVFFPQPEMSWSTSLS